jgi:hypothetical protein
MADGLGVLLLTWNNAFYRYGWPDLDVLEKCIARNQNSLDAFRQRDISSYSPGDDAEITRLYSQFLEALQVSDANGKVRQSPVAVAKALHVLAPAFFPLWDSAIAWEYGCHYKYILFIQKMQMLAKDLAPKVDFESTGRTLLKLIDEYNYAKFTKKWV